MTWTKKNKVIALIVGLLAGVALFAVYLTPAGELLMWQRYVIPIVYAFVIFMLVGSLLNRMEQYRKLKALPGVKFPFASLVVIMVLLFYFILVIGAAPFISLLAPGTVLHSVFYSWQHFLFFMLALVLLNGGGGYLLLNERPDGRIYRDCVSAAFFSRQDYFYSLTGHWDEGIIVGDKTFRYDEMTSHEEQERCLIIRGNEAETEQNYALMLYTPRIRKSLLYNVREHNIPGV